MRTDEPIKWTLLWQFFILPMILIFMLDEELLYLVIISTYLLNKMHAYSIDIVFDKLWSCYGNSLTANVG